jgi:hypothetical protein
MGLREQLRAVFPGILAHEGRWVGEYRHLDAAGDLLDVHEAEVRCEFPDHGAWAYVQHNHFRWTDGREQRMTLPGRLEGRHLVWDVATFRGRAWDSEGGVILLRVDRKDEPGVYFVEAIVANDAVTERARTWHWFKDGRLVRRTLCHETRKAGG